MFCERKKLTLKIRLHDHYWLDLKSSLSSLQMSVKKIPQTPENQQKSKNQK